MIEKFKEQNIDLIGLMNKVCRYDNYSEDDLKGDEICFEVDPGKTLVRLDFNSLTSTEAKLLYAIWSDVEVRWYEKSRNRGLGANFETNYHSPEEWLKMSESCPEATKEILDHIGWKDSYEYLYLYEEEEEA